MPFLITKEGVDTSVENYQSKEDRAKLDGARSPRARLPCPSMSSVLVPGGAWAGTHQAAGVTLYSGAIDVTLACVRLVRMRAVRVLHHVVPLLLVEQRQVFGSGSAAAVVPLAGR